MDYFGYQFLYAVIASISFIINAILVIYFIKINKGKDYMRIKNYNTVKLDTCTQKKNTYSKEILDNKSQKTDENNEPEKTELLSK